MKKEKRRQPSSFFSITSNSFGLLSEYGVIELTQLLNNVISGLKDVLDT